MKNINLILKTVFIGSVIVMSSCADDIEFVSIAEIPEDTITLAQNDVDNSTMVLAINEIGTVFPVSIGHNGQMPDQGNETTFRSSYTNLSDFTLPISQGAIFTKKTYNNDNGNKGDLQAFFGMIKREEGYWPDGGDFEYWMTPYDNTMLDTIQMPMGMIPPMVDDMMRGRIMMCASCHADPSSDGDFVFNYGASAILSVTQEDINQSINALSLFETGEVFPVSIGHNGQMPDQGNETTFRSTYTNLSDFTLPIEKGTIFTKKTYNNDNGSTGDLQAFFGMIKREAGYWPDGGDFEYWMTPYDNTVVDTLQMPMGLLPPMVDDMMRGKIMMCASCHADPSAEGDYIFNY